MKEGLSGSIVNEMEVNDRWSEVQKQSRENLNRLKDLEKTRPKTYVKSEIGYHSEGFKELANDIMKKRCKERFKRKIE